MIADFHFLRPWCFLAIIPLVALIWRLWQQSPVRLNAWQAICDPQLLDHLLIQKGESKRSMALIFFAASMLFILISIAGPAWEKLPVPLYKQIEPRVLVLDMSDSMLEKDLTPDRLGRARFKLHDILNRKDGGQFGLVVFTGEPFIVSPLTEDGATISSLLSTLTPDIMPVSGQKLASALSEAAKLITEAGYDHGQILVLTADIPDSDADAKAQELARAGINTSILPVRADSQRNPLFQHFAQSGGGQLLVYTADSSDLDGWLASENNESFILDKKDDIPLWRDEGRWFLLPALLFLLPVFQRGWLQRLLV